jgi:replicative DNA helicase
VKKPLMSDLRESGSLEQGADLVMLLYREDYYEEDTPDKNIAEVIVAKHRNGPVGTVRLFFQKEFTRYMELAEDGEFPCL